MIQDDKTPPPPAKRRKREPPPHAWGPGQSGNPAGSSKAKREERRRIAEIAREYTHEALETLAEIMRDAKAGSSSRVAAASALLDRAWGRPPQAHELTGPDGQQPMVGIVRIELVDPADREALPDDCAE